MSHERTVLVAVTGLSPAVLTETVWALSREKTPIVPDTVVVITTTSGRAAIEAQLFGEECVWDQLRCSILGPRADEDPRLDFDVTADRVKVVHSRKGSRRVPLDTLSSRSDHTAFADALSDELWLHTSKPDVRVIASLAGGYKTMSALMLSAMQLLANPGDRVTHVLVGDGYDTATPPFHFPEQNQQKLVARDGGTLVAKRAERSIQLIDVPVIPLRRWFTDALNRKPPSFETLVNSSIQALQERIEDVALEIGPVIIPPRERKHWINLNGNKHQLSPSRYSYLRFFAEKRKAGSPPFSRLGDIAEEIEQWLKERKEAEPRLHTTWESYSGENHKGTPLPADSIPKRLKDLRDYLCKLPGGRSLAAALPSKGAWQLSIPAEQITLR